MRPCLTTERQTAKHLKAYTWIYRWESPSEFKYEQEDTIGTAKNTLVYKPDEKKKYLMYITNNCPYIVVHHKAGSSKIKACNDIDHFHMIMCHSKASDVDAQLHHAQKADGQLEGQRVRDEGPARVQPVRARKIPDQRGRSQKSHRMRKHNGQKTMMRQLTTKEGRGLRKRRQRH